ncbi:FHA domain-containing protein [Candidatus Thiosymbion oneisti]|uniref:FHA domain-containing protein n=1 Tax=Candidatus Thiosymbion oneisti TaxID=589554 RepID=UPI000A688E47|nr:FHA domain-containing protein [Candidatus Thiosymbion oneisti]
MSIGDDDRTRIVSQGTHSRSDAPSLEIRYPGLDDRLSYGRYTHAFTIGRGEDCAIRLLAPGVSRHHVELFPQDGSWWARDLESSNGTLVNGRPIDRLPIVGTVTLELGREGPRIRVTAPPPTPVPEEPPRSLEDVSRHYLDAASELPAGEHTMLIRRAFKDVKRRQSRTYLALIFVVVLMLTAVSGVALFQYLQLQKMAGLANDIFYDMKELELHVANLESNLERDREDIRSARLRAEIAASKRKLARMREKYDAYAHELQTSRLIPPDSEELLILRLAKIFGETEVAVPQEFIAKVKEYIKKWQSSSRLENAIRRLRENNYAPTIRAALAGQGLPPQFIYVALQETNFQPRAVGPMSSRILRLYGPAKGMWQFIPPTGEKFGLKMGPLKHTRRYDPADERHDFRKASYAAAKYLKTIYRTDAQASGLLVMASYNWGEGNIIKRLRKMPENPRERNFWKLLRHHKIPNETYDYVFYIFSAAVICEHPRLFGFEFDNPLASP